MNVVRRASGMLFDPWREWAAIESEPGDAAYLLSNYVAVLAIVPALFSFVGVSLVGTVGPGGALTRAPVFDGLFGAVFGYVLTCASVLLLGIVIDLLAPLFGGLRSFDAAFKLAVYSFTPVWLAGVFLVLPGLRFLVLTGFYGGYVLWLGAPLVIKVPARQALNFSAIIVIIAFGLAYLTAVAQRILFATPGL